MNPVATTETVDVNKVELHCHLDGLLNPQMSRDLSMRGQDWSPSPAAWEALLPVRSSGGWTGYLEAIESCLTPPVPLNFCLEIHIENLIRQNVTYAEVMVSRMLLPREGEGKVIERFIALRQIVDRLQGNATQVELLVAIGRGPLERAERQAEQILALKKEG